MNRRHFFLAHTHTHTHCPNRSGFLTARQLVAGNGTLNVKGPGAAGQLIFQNQINTATRDDTLGMLLSTPYRFRSLAAAMASTLAPVRKSFFLDPHSLTFPCPQPRVVNGIKV